MKKNNSQRIKEILKKANSKFAGHTVREVSDELEELYMR